MGTVMLKWLVGWSKFEKSSGGRVGQMVAKPMNPAESLLVRRPVPTERLTTGCRILDRCLDGGIPCGSLTEITAESGSGKTQLCLQLALSAQLPPSMGGLSAAALYLYSEFPFPFRRLQQLSSSSSLDYVYVEALHSADQVFDEMSKIECFIGNSKTSKFPIRVIIIDSIAALFRSEFDNTPLQLKRRSSMFFSLSGKLKMLAKRFNLAVVLTNQVVDVITPNEGLNGLRIGNLDSLYSSGRQVCAALGLAWAHCVNSRLFLSRDEEEEIIVSSSSSQGRNGFSSSGGNGGECDGPSSSVICRTTRIRTRRRLHVVFAPHLPYSSCDFVISRDGVRGRRG